MNNPRSNSVKGSGPLTIRRHIKIGGTRGEGVSVFPASKVGRIPRRVTGCLRTGDARGGR